MQKPDPQQIDQTCRLMGKAQKLLAYGGLDGVIQRPMYDDCGGVFPHFATAARGFRIVDSTGQSFIDLVNGWGPVVLGYRNPEVEKAIVEQLAAGPTLSLMNPVEIEVAELITDMMPCAEMVAFGKNGSDAVAAAIRIARAVTQRDLILQFGFHGFHDWFVCQHETVQGIPASTRNDVRSFEYNDLNGLKKLFNENRDRVAAVIMEPVNMWDPEPGYLNSVREMTHANGALLIFDEIVTAFRLARGGAEEAFGVRPDLACLGKGIGNGMPLSAVVGKREYLQRLKRCGFGMTYRGETLSLAAAKATLQIIRDQPVTDHLRYIGNQIKKGFHEICAEIGIKCSLTGPGCRMTFMFHEQAGVPIETARALFLQKCLSNGVITNGNVLVNYAMNDQTVSDVLDVFRKSLQSLAELYSSNKNQTAPSVLPTGGDMHGIQALQATGFLDQIMDIQGDNVVVSGWILLDSGAPDSVQLQNETGDSVDAEMVERPGLRNAFPHHNRAEWAGFRARVRREMLTDEGDLKFSILANQSGQTRYRCVVNVQEGQQFSGPYSIDTGVLYL